MIYPQAVQASRGNRGDQHHPKLGRLAAAPIWVHAIRCDPRVDCRASVGASTDERGRVPAPIIPNVGARNVIAAFRVGAKPRRSPRKTMVIVRGPLLRYLGAGPSVESARRLALRSRS